VKFTRADTLRRFFDVILPVVTPTRSAASVLEVFASLDSDVDRLAERLNENPALGERWDRHVEKARGAEVPRRQSFVLLGMENARDFLVTGGGASGVSGSRPAAYGRAAQAAREALSKEKDSSPELAYAAGLVYDAFVLGAARWCPEPMERKTFVGEVERVASHGLVSARFAHGIARGVAGLSGARLAFAGENTGINTGRRPSRAGTLARQRRHPGVQRRQNTCATLPLSISCLNRSAKW
jgi:hypothetical protein